MQKKTMLLTGGTGGIGLETARVLAGQGHTLIITGRSPAKGEAVARTLREQTQNGQVSFLPLEVTSLASVRELARQVYGRTDRLDVLLNNAAVLEKSHRFTAEGFETDLAACHLSNVLLTRLLLPLLENAPGPRVVNVSTSGHRFVRQVRLEDFNYQKPPYVGLVAYAHAKTLNLLYLYHWAKELPRVGFIAADPGSALTGMTTSMQAKDFPLLMRLLFPVFKLVGGGFGSPGKAALSSVMAATGGELTGRSGIYLSPKGKVVKSSPLSYRQSLQEAVWRNTNTLLEPFLHDNPLTYYESHSN
jgi:NAD(P)-dependent dehydrogenase (short-subunit alcohol dehydrogenase family)